MLSVIKSLTVRVASLLRSLKVSTKITIMYAAILFLVLFLTTTIMGFGVYYSFYHQAEVDLDRSIRHVMDNIASGKANEKSFWSDGPVLPGVVVRIIDNTGRIIYETDSRFPSIALIESAKIKHPPFWANPTMEVSEFATGVAVYHAKRTINSEGKNYQLHFFRTITTEKDFLYSIQWILFFAIGVGFCLALVAGYFLGNIILQPLRDFSQTARKIEIEKLDRRLDVPPTRDELAELARTFNHMLDRLQEGFATQQRFISDASHELRTPLTIIMGYADLLSRWGHKKQDVFEESVDAISSEAENMEGLIDKLLFLARADQKRQLITKERFDIKDMLDDVLQKTVLVAKEHKVELRKNVSAILYADKVMLRQLLRIFIENSLKYTPDGGEIWVSSGLNDTGDRLLVTIADTGIGIAAEHQEKIFDRFYRVDSSRTKATGGSGLGLAIAKWIADQHDIKIILDSAEGKGTMIILSIPLAAETDTYSRIEDVLVPALG